MDVTPQLLKDVEFRDKKFGGYDPDEVDDFLERVGVAIGQLQLRLREASQRAEAAEARVAQAESQPAVAAETDDTLRRTLLLAQRTADAAVQEANEEASRKVAEAEETAERLISEAQEQHDRQLRESEDQVRRSIDETRERLLQEIHALEEIRDQLMSDVETLERHVEDERSHLQTALGTLQGLLEESGAMGHLDVPETSGVSSPAEAEPDFAAAPTPPVEPDFAAAPTPRVEPAPTFEPPASPPPTFESPEPPPSPPESGPEVLTSDLIAEESPGPSVWDTPSDTPFPSEPVSQPAHDPFSALAPEGEAPVIPAPAPRRADLAPEEPDVGDPDVFPQPPPPPPRPDRPSGFGGLGGPAASGSPDPWGDPGAEAGPSTEATPPIGEDPGGENPWMADLQREEEANQPPPPTDDDAMAEWYRQADAEEPKPEKGKRFGRKK